MFKEYEVQKIRYSKKLSENIETDDRTIIPTFVPKPNIKAIDVTDLTEEQQKKVCQLLKEYAEYVELQSKNLFSFEDWVEHTTGQTPEVSWRTFKISNTVVL